jgi:hypothetical protein
VAHGHHIPLFILFFVIFYLEYKCNFVRALKNERNLYEIQENNPFDVGEKVILKKIKIERFNNSQKRKD